MLKVVLYYALIVWYVVLIELIIELIDYILVIFKIYGLCQELWILILGYSECLLFDS